MPVSQIIGSHAAGTVRKLARPNVNVSKPERIVNAVAGGSLVALGLARRGVPGTLLGLLGGALFYRGVTGHCNVYQALGHSTAGPAPGIRFRESMAVEASPEELYRRWRSFEELPRFLRHVESVRPTSPTETHWVARTPRGYRMEWDARLTADEPGRIIAWESLPGSDLSHRGSIQFRPAPGGRGSLVDVQLDYNPLSGKPGAAFATFFGKGAELEMREDLRRFKQIVETGELPTTEGQTSGRARDRAAARRETERRSADLAAVPASPDLELVEVPS